MSKGKVHQVVWHEGMLLAPHHFQQWDLHQNQLLFEHRNLEPFPWGITELDINTDALRTGMFVLERFRGVLKDGLVVRAPEVDELPSARSLEGLLSANIEQIEVYLAVPNHQSDSVNYRLDGSGENSLLTRYSGTTATVTDQNTGSEREIVVARKNLRILFSREDAAGFQTLKVAELIRAPGGKVRLRETYVPPCLTISASTRLMTFLNNLIHFLLAKRDDLLTHLPQRDVTGVDASLLLRLHVFNTHLPALLHYSAVGQVNPQTLYLELARTLGQLATVFPQLNIKEIVSYEHTELDGVFSALDKQIRDLLEQGMPGVELLLLRKSDHGVWLTDVLDEKLFETGKVYLAAGGGLLDDEVPEFEEFVKIGGKDVFEEVVQGAVEGIPLIRRDSAPPTIPGRPGFKYFAVTREGIPQDGPSAWRSARRDKCFGIWVPEAFKHVTFELIWAR